jgi:dihydroorotate dehydrogenase (fumarate)
MKQADLATRYLGLDLANPLVAASSPLTGRLGTLRELERSGVAAVVLPSLFQEQIEHEELELARLHEFGAESFPEASSYLPELEGYNTGPDGYLRLVERMREDLTIPVIASLNGLSPESWAHYAQRIEDAGASAIEMNVLFIPTDPARTADDVEALVAEQVAAVTRAVSVPVAVKVGSHLSAPAHFASRLWGAGAAGLVLFNRFLEPDIDLETMDVVPRLELSYPFEMRMALRWIAILSPRTRLSLAATGGIHSATDAIKLLAAGADAVMVASALLHHGPAYLGRLLGEMRAWLEENEFTSVRQLKGSMNHENCPNPAGFERLNYMKALLSYSSAQP